MLKDRLVAIPSYMNKIHTSTLAHVRGVVTSPFEADEKKTVNVGNRKPAEFKRKALFLKTKGRRRRNASNNCDRLEFPTWRIDVPREHEINKTNSNGMSVASQE